MINPNRLPNEADLIQGLVSAILADHPHDEAAFTIASEAIWKLDGLIAGGKHATSSVEV